MLRALLAPLLAAALLNLDRRAFLESMIGRPLAAGAAVGWLSGLPAQGVALGLWSELLWFWTIPVGGSHTPNPGLAVSTAVAALSIVSRGGASPGPDAAAPLAFLLVPALAWLYMLPDRINRRMAEGLQLRTRADIESGKAPSFFLRNLTGLVQTFLLSLPFLLAGTALSALALTGFVHALPEGSWAVLQGFWGYAPLCALLGMAASLSRSALIPWFLGLCTGILALALWRMVF